MTPRIKVRVQWIKLLSILVFGGLCYLAGYKVKSIAVQKAHQVRIEKYKARKAKIRTLKALKAKARKEKENQSKQADQHQAKKDIPPNWTPVPSVRPLAKHPRDRLPQGHPRVPASDRQIHPTFDCRALKAAVPQNTDQLSITELLAQKNTQNEISVNAFVIGAYYNILNTNWYHLCDAPDGQVLVVSSTQFAPQKSLITVKGSLLFDYNLSDLYRFPLYIKDAVLSGTQVRSIKPSLPPGVSEL